MKNNILMLGGTGFLGTNCVKALEKDNAIFIVGDSKGSRASYSNFYDVRIEESEKIIKLIEENNIDIVIHFISSLVPVSGRDSFVNEIQNVYIPTIAVLEYCSERRIRFAYVSSGGAIYGNAPTPFMETVIPEPISYYGFTKLAFENLITFYHRTKGLEYLIVRPSNPYGFGQNIYRNQGLIAVIMGKIKKNEPIEIWGNGDAAKDFIFIDDFTFYIKYLIENKSCWNNVYNIGSGISSSIMDVLEAFRQNGITLPQITFVPEKKTDVKHVFMDCGKIRNLVRHDCVSLVEGIKFFYNDMQRKLHDD